jgi:hypothetical protein
VYLGTKKNITCVLDSEATDLLVKEDTRVINNYKLCVPTKICIAKNNKHLLAYEKNDVIAETYVSVEVRNIRIPDVLFVKTCYTTYYQCLRQEGVYYKLRNGTGEIIKSSTVVGVANRDGDLYTLTMTVKEVDDRWAYSAVNMRNSKIWHSRLGHVGNDQFQQWAKTVD